MQENIGWWRTCAPSGEEASNDITHGSTCLVHTPRLIRTWAGSSRTCKVGGYEMKCQVNNKFTTSPFFSMPRYWSGCESYTQVKKPNEVHFWYQLLMYSSSTNGTSSIALYRYAFLTQNSPCRIIPTGALSNLFMHLFITTFIKNLQSYRQLWWCKFQDHNFKFTSTVQ